MKIKILTLCFTLLSSISLLYSLDYSNDFITNSEGDTISFFDWIRGDNITEMRIYMDFDTVIGDKKEKEYAGAYIVPVKDGVALDSIEAEVRARGNLRNRICKFPPLKVKLKKKALNNIGLNDMNEFKVVTHCQSSGSFKDYVRVEKLIYDLYNIISPYSYRANLVMMDYYDIKSNKSQEKKVAIMLEHVEELEKRLNGKEIPREKGFEQWVQDEIALQVAVFQYMIGNTDFAYANMHNLMFFKVPEHPKLLSIPFDFDYCGAVDAHYAIPNENLTIEDVKTRYFQGMCRSDEMLYNVIEKFKSHREEVLNTIENYEALDSGDRSRVYKYIEKFFKMLENPKKCIRSFKTRC